MNRASTKEMWRDRQNKCSPDMVTWENRSEWWGRQCAQYATISPVVQYKSRLKRHVVKLTDMQALMTFEPSCIILVLAEASTFITDLLQEFTKSVTTWNGWKCDFQKEKKNNTRENSKQKEQSQAWQISHKQFSDLVINFSCKQVTIVFLKGQWSKYDQHK